MYASSGDDCMLKEWDATTFALKREIDLGGEHSMKTVTVQTDRQTDTVRDVRWL